MLKVILVDDEPHANDALAAVLEGITPKVEILKVCNNTKEASAAIIKFKPDLVFLDIMMPEETGIEFLIRLEQFDFDVVFVTAYDKFAIDAIRLSALDYIMKPIRASEVETAVKNAFEKHDARQKEAQRKLLSDIFMGVRKHIMLYTKNGDYELLKFQDILYCKADQYMTNFFVADGRKLSASKNIGEYKDILPDVIFIQTNQSYIVNKEAAHKYNASDQTLTLKNGHEIPISLTYKEKVLDWLKSK